MKKISWLLIIAFTLTVGNRAQAQQSEKWTLEQCIQYAISNNINVKQLALQKEDAAVNLNTAKMSWVPDLNANVRQNWGFGKSLNTNTNGYETQTNAGSNFGISSNMPLFTGFRISNQIARGKLDLKAATQSLERAKEELSINIASLFLQVLLNRELLIVSQERLKLSEDQVKKTEVLVEVGKVPVSQLYDIQAQVANNEVGVVQARNDLELSLLDLAQSLELERSVDFDVQEPDMQDVLENNLESLLPPEIIYENAIAFKPIVKEQEFKLKSAEKSLKIAQAGYYPTLNLGVGYSNNYFYTYNMSNLPFKDQINNNGGESIGLTLDIPIFNRFSVRNQVKSARLNIENQRLLLENTKKTLYKEIQTAYMNATAYQEKFRASARSVTASQEAFKYEQERYEIGKSTVFEFNDAQNKLIQSLSEQIQAKYEYIFRSKILDFYNGIPITL